MSTKGTKFTEKKQLLNVKKMVTCLVSYFAKVLLDLFVFYVLFAAQLLFVGWWIGISRRRR